MICLSRLILKLTLGTIHLARTQNFRKYVGSCAYQGVQNVMFLENIAYILSR